MLNWRGTRYTLVNPATVAGPDARSAFHPVERLLLKVAGVHFVHMQQALQ
jgi:hypothetical protein